MNTPVNLITGCLLLFVYSCQSPPLSEHTVKTTAQPRGSYVAEINEQTATLHDTASYTLTEWNGSNVTTPYGGLFRLRIPDRAQIILSAATRVSFPKLSGKMDQLTLKGEIFLTTTTPLQVNTGAASIAVPANTSVNIKAYEEDGAVEISPYNRNVAVTWNNQSGNITAGQHGVLKNSLLQQRHANRELIEGWRDGRFTEADPGELLREIARWYNVQLLINGPIPAMQLEGAMPRTAELTSLVKILQANSIPIHFDTTRQAIIVSQSMPVQADSSGQ
ncbi:MAG: hypothetical protein ACTHMC_17750 [Pseudobacter sp.]|uniref:hypothetical protein n=1 Tax=Pseudobacter sp. TaxID=2045420 RepID=UPI003F7E619A